MMNEGLSDHALTKQNQNRAKRLDLTGVLVRLQHDSPIPGAAGVPWAKILVVQLPLINVLLRWTRLQQRVSIASLLLPNSADIFSSRSSSKDWRRTSSKKGHTACRCASNSICEQRCSASKPSSNRHTQTTSPLPKSSSPSAGQSTSNLNGEIYIADGDYIKDIEVNDLRNRYTLTKGSTQKMVNILVTYQPAYSGLRLVPMCLLSVHLCVGNGSLLCSGYSVSCHANFCIC